MRHRPSGRRGKHPCGSATGPPAAGSHAQPAALRCRAAISPAPQAPMRSKPRAASHHVQQAAYPAQARPVAPPDAECAPPPQRGPAGSVTCSAGHGAGLAAGSPSNAPPHWQSERPPSSSVSDSSPPFNASTPSDADNPSTPPAGTVEDAAAIDILPTKPSKFISLRHSTAINAQHA